MKLPAGRVKSVVKVLDILEHLAAARGPLSVSEIGRATGIHVSTAHRLLQTLAHRGYVEQDGGTRAYRLGPRVFELGSSYLSALDLISVARPHLEALRDKLDETIHLAIYNRGEVVELGKASGNQAITVSVRLGQRYPAYCTALGKVLLAFLPPHELARFFQEVRLERRTPNTVTKKSELLRELEEVRRRGYALDDEEMGANLCCVGVPIRDSIGRVVAALSVAMPKMRFKTAMIPGWARLLGERGGQISRQLGFLSE